MRELRVIRTDRYMRALEQLQACPVLWVVAATTIGEPLEVLADENGPIGDFAAEAERRYDAIRKDWKDPAANLYTGPRYPELVADAALRERSRMLVLLKELGRLGDAATEDQVIGVLHLFWDAVMGG